MNVETVEHYQNLFEKRSLVLNPQPKNERPRNTAFLSSEDLLLSIKSQFERLKELRRRAKESFKRTKHFMYQDQANKISGKLLCIEHESRILTAEISEHARTHPSPEEGRKMKETRRKLKRVLNRKGTPPIKKLREAVK